MWVRAGTHSRASSRWAMACFTASARVVCCIGIVMVTSLTRRCARTGTGPVVVGNGWNGFARVFGGGQGVIYAVKPDGTLLWYRHTGYLTGQRTWEGPKVVGSGWQNFSKVFYRVTASSTA